MKKIFLTLAILAATVFYTSAQNQPNPHRGRKVGNIEKSLNLSAEQIEQKKAIDKGYAEKFATLRADSALTSTQRREAVRAIGSERNDAIKNILTPEQNDKYSKMTKRQDARPKKMKGSRDVARKERGTRHQRPDRFKDLNLTADQKEQMKKLNNDFRSKTKDLASEHRLAINSVLTTEQQDKLKEMRKAPNRKHRFEYRHMGQRNHRMQFDTETMAKLKALRESFAKDRAAINNSSADKQEQGQQLKDLRKKYSEQRKAITKDAIKIKKEQPKA